jgi:hypothetical protein
MNKFDQPSGLEPERWEHHWRFCPEKNLVVVRDNWAYRVTYCRGCPNRTIETKPQIFLLTALLNCFMKMYAEHVFDDRIGDREL